MNLNNINNKKVFEYLKNEVIPNKNSLSNKELALAIMVVSHLNGENNFKLGFSGSVMGGSMLGGLVLSTNVVGLLGLLAVGTVATVNAVCSDLKRKQIKEMENELTECLLKRYDNFETAYNEVAKLITSISTEEIVEYLENANK